MRCEERSDHPVASQELFVAVQIIEIGSNKSQTISQTKNVERKTHHKGTYRDVIHPWTWSPNVSR